MPRTYGKMLCSANDDGDWLALSPGARVLYTAFLAERDITAAGILALTERRWRKYLHGDPAAVATAVDELAAGGFVMVDEDTSELWIRTFIKHDGRLENGNLAKSVHRAIEMIRSETLQTACGKQYPDITPARRAFEGPSKGDGKGPERDVEGTSKGRRRDAELLDLRPRPLTPTVEQVSSHPPSGLDDERIEEIVSAITTARCNGNTNPNYVSAVRASVVTERGEKIHRWVQITKLDAPVDSIAHAVETGDGRNLTQWLNAEPDADDEDQPTLTREQRLKLITDNRKADTA